MEVFALGLLALGIASTFALALAYQSVLLRLGKRKPELSLHCLPPVTVLKPLRGVDPGLYENLRAMIEQDHPDFEIIFGAEDPFDPALQVARRLVSEFPDRRLLVVGGGAPQTGTNPKVRILRRMIEFASREWILISDSNVRPGPDYLRTMQAVQMDQGADLVHTVLSGCPGEGLGARLEELQLGGWVAAAICFAQRFDHPCVIGKSMLMRKSYLDGQGALVRMQDILAEDYMMGADLHRSGHKVALAPYRLPVVTGNSPLQAFLNRHIRWGQMRRRIAPLSFFLELSANPTPFLLLSMPWLEGRLLGVALFVQLFKWSMDLVAYASLSQSASLRTAALIPVKDVLVLFMWCVSAVKRTVRWRGHTMWVGANSRLTPVKSRSVRGLPEELGQLGV